MYNDVQNKSFPEVAHLYCVNCKIILIINYLVQIHGILMDVNNSVSFDVNNLVTLED